MFFALHLQATTTSHLEICLAKKAGFPHKFPLFLSSMLRNMFSQFKDFIVSNLSHPPSLDIFRGCFQFIYLDSSFHFHGYFYFISNCSIFITFCVSSNNSFFHAFQFFDPVTDSRITSPPPQHRHRRCSGLLRRGLKGKRGFSFFGLNFFVLFSIALK